MQIDSKSPCGTCEKSNRCKTENKNKVRECGAYKPSEFFEMFRRGIAREEISCRKTKIDGGAE